MSRLMLLQDVAESTRLGPLSGEIKAGEILHLVGPNGAGKSTLLARMAGLTTGEGCITFGDTPLGDWPAAKLAQYRAYLAQQQNPPFAMPVWHFLTLHQPDKARTDLLQEVADALGLGDKLGRGVNQLSGGNGNVCVWRPSSCK
ncbi:vitamin B12-transporter ATPase [Citrobacter youngae]|nr:vitamin B12-transporter ATPase [Citrobacter youngae]